MRCGDGEPTCSEVLECVRSRSCSRSGSHVAVKKGFFKHALRVARLVLRRRIVGRGAWAEQRLSMCAWSPGTPGYALSVSGQVLQER